MRRQHGTKFPTRFAAIAVLICATASWKDAFPLYPEIGPCRNPAPPAEVNLTPAQIRQNPLIVKQLFMRRMTPDQLDYCLQNEWMLVNQVVDFDDYLEAISEAIPMVPADRFSSWISNSIIWGFKSGSIGLSKLVRKELKHYRYTSSVQGPLANNPLVWRGITLGPSVDAEWAIFGAYVDFEFSQFPEETSFRNATFAESADFVYTKFHGRLDFEKSRFVDRVDFGHAHFMGLADFSEADVEGNARFFEATFHRKVIFSATEFHGQTHFERAIMKKYSVFRETQFGSQVDFFGTTFDEASFEDARFRGHSDFGRAKFKEVRFHGTHFMGSASFRASVFRPPEDAHLAFQQVRFQDNADFRSVTASELGFSGTTFAGNYLLRDSTIEGELYFSSVSVQGVMDLRRARIGLFSWSTPEVLQEVHGPFDATETVLGGLRFSDIRFFDFVDFSRAKLGLGAMDTVLDRVIFEKEAEFIRSTFFGDGIFFRNKFRTIWDLNYATFAKDAHLCWSFNGVEKLKLDFDAIVRRGNSVSHVFPIQRTSQRWRGASCEAFRVVMRNNRGA